MPLLRLALVAAALTAAGPARAATPDCGTPLVGADPLLRRGLTVLLGEVPGTQEVPRVVESLVCHAARAGVPVTLALELPRDEQPRLERYLASAGSDEDLGYLLDGSFWHRPYADGKSSRAVARLLERTHRLRQGGADVRLLAYDVVGQGTPREREAAQGLLDAHRRDPNRLWLVLTGNVRARTLAGTTPWDPGLLPLGHFLEQALGSGLLALDVDHGGGRAWNCQLVRGGALRCGPTRWGAPLAMRRHFMRGASVERAFLGERPYVLLSGTRSPEGFHGLYYVGPLTVSPPVDEGR